MRGHGWAEDVSKVLRRFRFSPSLAAVMAVEWLEKAAECGLRWGEQEQTASAPLDQPPSYGDKWHEEFRWHLSELLRESGEQISSQCQQWVDYLEQDLRNGGVKPKNVALSVDDFIKCLHRHGGRFFPPEPAQPIQPTSQTSSFIEPDSERDEIEFDDDYDF